ncbi:acyl-CoA dehydrogenase family protein, partial [Oleiphilus sp. HI0086]|uniref:acyl-CoA dehydrogenase family protein n=1 Tax=Oleiphilus sp. HI0086 TaxID=1822260 RepID=UPI000A7B8212
RYLTVFLPLLVVRHSFSFKELLKRIASAESILEQTVAYVKERKAFGREIASFQNTQFKLAEMSATLTMARVFVDKCLELHI